MSDYSNARPYSMDLRRVHRASLSPRDAAAIYSNRKRTSSADYDPEEMYKKLQEEAAARETLQRNRRSVNSIDSLPSRPISIATTNARFVPSPPISPMSATFPFRTKHAAPRTKVPIFKRLPQEVYDVILNQLQILHSDKLSPSCPTCFMRDLVSLQLTSRSWDKAVRGRLYERITVAGQDSAQQLKKYKVKNGTRLKLLRRTLRERRALANLVKELTVPDADVPIRDEKGKINPQCEEYRELVASVVMVCPNLERLLGFYPSYNHEFDRLTHALSTRKNLKERVWVIAQNKEVSYRSQIQLPPGLLDQLQAYQWLQFHASWTELETLMLVSVDEAAIIEEHLFTQAFQFLPKLKHLCISSFDGDDFTDRALLALPSLTSLRLENLPGLSDKGLARWAATPSGHGLKSLSLIQQNVESLFAVSKLLASLPNLQKFTFVQTNLAPEVPSDLIIFQPILASPSLTSIHWDVASTTPKRSTDSTTSQPSSSINFKTANTHLALSIMHSGFPKLLSLRAPSDTDPPGALQAVCRPTKDAQILLPADRYSLPPKHRAPRAAMPELLPQGNSLHSARVRAQSYMDVAAKTTSEFVKVVITDHSDYEPDAAKTNSRTSSSKYSTESSKTTDSTDLTSDFNEKFNLEDHLVSSQQSSESILATLSRQPLKIHEFSLPGFVGRVYTSAVSYAPRPPKFNLIPDLPGYDANGGVVGWDDLLKTKNKVGAEKTGAGTGATKPVMRDGCTGSWNQAHGKGPDWWRHVERERRGPVVEGGMLF